jgi:hypothetical protein
MNKKKGLEGFSNHVDATKQHKVDEKINDLVSQNQKLERKYNVLLDEHVALQEENDLLTSVDLQDVTPIEVKPTMKGKIREGYVLAVASDWHVLETVKPEEVNGLNVYNRKIAEQSVEAFWQGVHSWLEVHRSKLAVPKMGVALLGDFITNMIHDDQVETNEGTPQEEILFALDLMIGGIDFLLKEGDLEQLDLYCCDGNHGRDTKYTRKANRVKHSHEWLLYNFLKKWYADRDERVKFNIAAGYHLYIDMYGRRIRTHHGDEVRYQGGVGGLTIPMNKAIAQWDKAMRADLDIFGHFHHFLNPTKFISNGSLLGYNPYALSIKAAYEAPMQVMAMFDSKHWLTSVDRIFVR